MTFLIQIKNNHFEEYEKWLHDEKIKSQNSYREELDKQVLTKINFLKKIKASSQNRSNHQ